MFEQTDFSKIEYSEEVEQTPVSIQQQIKPKPIRCSEIQENIELDNFKVILSLRLLHVYWIRILK